MGTNAKPMQKLSLFFLQSVRNVYFSSQKKTIMRCRLLAVLILAGFFSYNSYSQSNDSVFAASVIRSYSLQNTDDGMANYSIPNTGTKPVLFLFLSTECPLCQNYTAALNALYKQYKNQVVFYGILPGNTYTSSDVKTFISTYQISFPLLIDDSEKLTRYLQTTVTPEALLMDAGANLLYKGAIDNWLVSLGKKRIQATEHYLQDALDNTIHHTNIKIKRTKAIGCKLNDF